MDDKGYLNVRALTCAQLANTFQEDADFLGAWYSGWWNGHMKRHSVNVARAKEGIHEVIVYCKANPDTKVVDAVDAYVKKVQAGGSRHALRRNQDPSLIVMPAEAGIQEPFDQNPGFPLSRE